MRHPAIDGTKVRISLDARCPAKIASLPVIVDDLDGSAIDSGRRLPFALEFFADVRIEIVDRGTGDDGPGLLQKHQQELAGPPRQHSLGHYWSSPTVGMPQSRRYRSRMRRSCAVLPLMLHLFVPVIVTDTFLPVR